MSTVTILDIQRMSSEDGPGLRTTVFLKGCPLACRWCHNPESIALQGQVLWHPARCIGCKSCPAACPRMGLHFGEDGVTIERPRCLGCFACCEACPTGALEPKGRAWDCGKLCRELLKDRAYFGPEGGVTISGGEALMQEGTVELLRLLKEQGAQTALDTCGLVPEDRLSRALEHTDLVLYDVKIADSAAHKEWTGVGNEKILENLRRAADWAAAGGRLWVRTPMIPGATDTEENITAIGAILAALPKGAIERWELCAFNNLCASKYESLGQRWEFAAAPLMARERMEALAAVAQATNACEDTRWTGAVRTAAQN
ncbi:MAG: glycyl-radical enzyme activating protein [Oscillospiraceae bacterium]|jgi:pyruvate formate lyase activating enzyme|nr:glycyl-radical enzyme activating protein [Oscillospiraceae bacterium]